MAPTTGVILEKGGDMRAVAADADAIHRYCRACREAGDVLRRVGYRKRQPAVFHLYYWLPRWLESKVFAKLFGSRSGEVRFGLHARSVGPELLEMVEEFAELKARAGLKTPILDALLANVPRPRPANDRQSRGPVLDGADELDYYLLLSSSGHDELRDGSVHRRIATVERKSGSGGFENGGVERKNGSGGFENGGVER